MDFPPANWRAKFSDCGAALSGGSLLRFLNDRLTPMQEISAALRMGGGGKDRPLVFLQHLEPALNIGGVIASHLRCQFQIGA